MNVRQLGVVNGFLHMIDRALRSVSGDRVRLVRYLLVAQPVRFDPENQVRPSASSPVRRVASTDPVVTEFPRPREVIARRFAMGSRCYVAEVRERFAGFLWLAFDSYDEDEVRCCYEFAKPGLSVWDYDVYVKPEFRMGRTFARLWDTANRDLASDGVRWTFSRVSAFNLASITAHRRMGMSTLFSATFICLGRFQMAFIGAAPYLHLGWSKASRPILTLRVPST